MTDSNIGFELQVSPEQSVMHKNGFSKLATLCGALRIDMRRKNIIKANYQRRVICFQLRFKKNN